MEINQQKLAVVFPGQGSQSVAMLTDIAAQFGEVAEIFARASDVLGYDLWELTKLGPAETLDLTEHTQPALLAASYAIWCILQSRLSLNPAFLAGHSLGEYTALVCAKAISFEEAIRLVAARGRYMQEAVQAGEGAMAAIIGLDDATIKTICAEVIAEGDEVLSPANFNSPGQVVIAGHKQAVLRAIPIAKEKGAKLVVMLPVSVPSHCELMQKAAIRLQNDLANVTLDVPVLPVINNVDVLPYCSQDAIRDGLIRQLYLPVHWVETIQYLVQEGVTSIIECGPGKVLTGLNKRIAKQLHLFSTFDINQLTELLKEYSHVSE